MTVYGVSLSVTPISSSDSAEYKSLANIICGRSLDSMLDDVATAHIISNSNLSGSFISTSLQETQKKSRNDKTEN